MKIEGIVDVELNPDLQTSANEEDMNNLANDENNIDYDIANNETSFPSLNEDVIDKIKQELKQELKEEIKQEIAIENNNYDYDNQSDDSDNPFSNQLNDSYQGISYTINSNFIDDDDDDYDDDEPKTELKQEHIKTIEKVENFF
jgi:hypothetical protein